MYPPVQTILVVDDEKNIVRVLKAYLEREGYGVLTAYDGEEALRLARLEAPDLVILDLMLPALSGEEVCRSLRRDGSRVPVIILTAKSRLDEKLYGLAIGADDYIVKPFSPQEVVARVKSVLRRSAAGQGLPAEIFSLAGGALEIDTLAHSVSLRGQALELTPTEFKLLAFLGRHPGRVFTRGQLSETAFGYSGSGYDRTIDVHIKNLRRKLEKTGAPDLIKTVYGVGYKLEDA